MRSAEHVARLSRLTPKKKSTEVGNLFKKKWWKIIVPYNLLFYIYNVITPNPNGSSSFPPFFSMPFWGGVHRFSDASNWGHPDVLVFWAIPVRANVFKDEIHRFWRVLARMEENDTLWLFDIAMENRQF